MATSTDLRAAIREIQETMRPEGGKVDLEEALRRARENWTGKFEERIGALPWWLVSTISHGVILVLAATMFVAVPPAREEEVIITSPEPRPPIEKFVRSRLPAFREEARFLASIDEHKDRPAPDRAPRPESVEVSAEIHDEVEAFGIVAEELDSIPLGLQGVCSSVSDVPVLSAEDWGYMRGPGRERYARRGGGGPDTLNSVDRALEWLARHQEADGHWISRKHDVAVRTRPARVIDRANTALALLAFLGSGHTPTQGRYRSNVRRAVYWLMRQQGRNGAFYRKAGGYKQAAGYQHAICGLALAEVYGMTRDPIVKAAAQSAVDYSVRRHQTPHSGWRYDPRGGADLSVTGWFVMQLKSASMAGLRVDRAGFQGAGQFVARVSDERGRCGYTSNRRVSPAMTSVGMLSRQFLGADNRDPMVRGAAAYLVQNLPHGGERADPKTFYYWYYGTLSMFQYGGARWRKWNAAMKKNLLESQRTKGDARGSWDPKGTYDRMAGRVYTTAMGALTLEVYYRYFQMYPR